MGRKLGGGYAPGLRPTSMPSTSFIHPAVWSQETWAENLGMGLRPFLGGGAWSPSNTVSPWPRPSSIPSDILMHAAIWPQQIWAENWPGAVPLWGWGAGSPSNTMWPGTRPTCMPSFVLIRAATVHERHRQAGQDRQDNGPIAYRANRFTNGRSKFADGTYIVIPASNHHVHSHS